MNRIHALTALALAAAISAGCAHTKPAGTVVLKGLLTQGAECPLLVTADGHRYSVTGSLGRFQIGDRVCVRGTKVETSICMAGEATLAIDAIGPENDCP